MVTATKERRLGQPRSDIERLVQHHGISVGEAEELLRLYPVEALLPQRGTGLQIGTAAGIASPDPRFVTDQCFFPATLRVDELFTAKWIVSNQGDSGEVALLMAYKEKYYAIWVGTLETGYQATLQITEPGMTINEFLEYLGVPEQIENTQTLDLGFITGYVTVKTAETITIVPTDRWDVEVHVEVGLVIPWWGWAAGGVAVVGIGLVALKPRKK